MQGDKLPGMWQENVTGRKLSSPVIFKEVWRK
jgi:hypothetical protein